MLTNTLKNKYIKAGIFLAMIFLTPKLVSAQQTNSVFPQNLFALPEWSYDRSLHEVSSLDTAEKAVEYDDMDSNEEFNEDDLAIYRPSGNKLYLHSKLLKDPNSEAQKVWDIFTEIAGAKFNKKIIRNFATYDLPNDPVLGFVVKIARKTPHWGFAINTGTIDFSDKESARESVIVMLHEFGHLLSLSADQVNYLETSSRPCSKVPSQKGTYEIGWKSCSKKDSYINTFVGKFWDNNQIALVAHNSSFATQLYNLHMTDFVTEYSATSPTEDIAESFTDFILQKKPLGLNKKEQKILFFYNYPELVKIRNEVRPKIAKYFF